MPLIPEFFPEVEAFEWDAGNTEKSRAKHAVSWMEAEQVFFNRPIVVTEAYSLQEERRHFGLGQTNAGRLLTIVFTIRGSRLRVISARPMSRRERRVYAKVQAH
jgi:uncharacterized DUF497 family protein